MRRHMKPVKRKRDPESSSSDEFDNGLSTTEEIQLSPVPSILSTAGSTSSDSDDKDMELKEVSFDATKLNSSDWEVSDIHLPDNISFSESNVQSETLQPQGEHELVQETEPNSTNFNTSVLSMQEEILDSVVPDAESLCDSESSSSDSNEESDSDISFHEETMEFKGEEDLPVYEGAPLSVNDSMVAILCYVIRHELDGTEIDDLLDLINLHCKREFNKMKTSLYYFKKYFSCLDTPVTNHYYCSTCYSKLSKEHGQISKCPNAALHPNSSGHSIFVEVPLIPQLQDLFCQEKFYSNLSYRYARKKMHEKNLEDIYDGQVYKELEAMGFLSKDKPHNFTMIMNTDGIPVFKSTNKSLWPIFLNVNELPPHLRFKKEYTLIGGMWFGGKPQANLMLDPLLKTFQTIKKGFKIQNSMTAKGALIAATTDLPAKVMITGMASYSGSFGCQICKIKGESVKITKKIRGKTKEKGKGEMIKETSTWVYKYSNDLDLRSHSETIRLGKEAHEVLKKTGDFKKTNVQGVKFPSAFFKIMHDGIRGFAVDDLHTLYLGVTKTLIKLWFDSSHSSEPFSLRKYLPLVDERLAAVKLPNFIKRSVRKIESDFAYWKGTELQTFAHYLSLPVLEGIMPDKYLEHHADLVSSIHVLESSSISPEELLSCGKKLDSYAKNFEILYGTRYMAMVFHLLRHLCFVVNNLGTMRYASCFYYEGLNAEILNMIHGTKYVETQLASGCFLIRQLPKTLKTLRNEQVKDFCTKLLNPSLRLKKLEDIDTDTFSVGTYTLMSSPPPHIFDCLVRSGKQDCTIESFLKLQKGKLLFVVSWYKRCSKKISSFCSFLFGGTMKHGRIEIFLKVSENGGQNVTFVAIVQFVSVTPYVIGSKEVPHTFHYALTSQYEEIPLSNLRQMLVCVEVGDRSYLCYPI